MIRQASIDDLDQIVNLRMDTWKAACEGIVSDENIANADYEGLRKRLENAFEDQNPSSIYVFEDESRKMAGFVWFGDALNDPGYDSEIYMLYILPEYQNRGIGQALMRYSIEKISKIGHNKIIIWTFAENLPARKFYERLGGILVKERLKRIGEEELKQVGYRVEIQQ